MAAILLFLRSPLAKYIGLALAALALLAGIYAKGRGDGRHYEQSAQAARLAAARKVVAKIETKAAAITAQVAAKAEARQVEIRTITKTITREVPRYVTVQADAQCSVPLGFVRLHDAAAAGRLPQLPGPAEQPNDAPSGVAISAVAATVADNYGACHSEIGRLIDLQDWLRQQMAAHPPP
jgi:hypothetical protein